jgi:hypothetical protein
MMVHDLLLLKQHFDILDKCATPMVSKADKSRSLCLREQTSGAPQLFLRKAYHLSKRLMDPMVLEESSSQTAHP